MTSKQDIDGTATFGRGTEPAPATTVLRHMVYGSGLVHALDYVVLLHLLFMLEEDRPVTVKDLWERLQAEGIRSAKNANELVGRDAVYQSVKRLIAAKFVYRVEEGAAPGKFGSVRYLVYRQPAYHPEFVSPREPWEPQDDPDFPHAKPQVGPLPGTPEAGTADSSSEGKTAGRTASRNAGYGNAGYGVPGSGRPRIPAGRTAYGVPGSGPVSPPTPPQEEVETSSPYPLTDRNAAQPSQKEEGQDAAQQQIDPARVATAAELLADLSAPWTCGRKSVREMAPLLAQAAAEQGWPLGPELAQHLTQNPGGIKYSYMGTLKSRIEDLPRYRRAAAGPGEHVAGEACRYHPTRDAATCPVCASVPPLPDDEPPTAVTGEPDPEHVRAGEAAMAQIRQSIVNSTPGGKSARRRSRTKSGRAAAQQLDAEEFERRRAQALTGLEALENNLPGDGA
ncbi:hypothetical protein [Streptantibioticus ferralitis]|uniref:Uncharacterized protein n=1 Tax=Streptantibioticus ferralitis TaxID=236510 RepID=A0ABT5ZB63_9ACTN|nr:hypothetical protein [Streptantibioticus ferralitis]MDF2260913.1 hypothetical protein [Streptantibioticus ferralitis]